jgi:hypothetical protein
LSVVVNKKSLSLDIQLNLLNIFGRGFFASVYLGDRAQNIKIPTREFSSPSEDFNVALPRYFASQVEAAGIKKSAKQIYTCRTSLSLKCLKPPLA